MNKKWEKGLEKSSKKWAKLVDKTLKHSEKRNKKWENIADRGYIVGYAEGVHMEKPSVSFRGKSLTAKEKKVFNEAKTIASKGGVDY